MACNFITSAPNVPADPPALYYCVTFANVLATPCVAGCDILAAGGPLLFINSAFPPPDPPNWPADATCLYLLISNPPIYSLPFQFCGVTYEWTLEFTTDNIILTAVAQSGPSQTIVWSLPVSSPIWADYLTQYNLPFSSDSNPGLTCDFSTSIATITPNNTGICSGDPHFIGFENDRFDFHGVPDKIYNLLSDYNVSVNSLFGDYEAAPGTTYLKEIGITVGTSEVGLTKILFSSKGGIYLNGKLMKKKKEEFPTGLITKPTGSIEISMNNNWGSALTALAPDVGGPGVFQNGVIINTGTFKLSIARLKDGCASYMCILMDFMALPVAPHGIVGQTADFDGKPRIGLGPQGEGVIEGVGEDYEVKELFSPDFSFSRFGKLTNAALTNVA